MFDSILMVHFQIWSSSFLPRSICIKHLSNRMCNRWVELKGGYLHYLTNYYWFDNSSIQSGYNISPSVIALDVQQKFYEGLPCSKICRHYRQKYIQFIIQAGSVSTDLWLVGKTDLRPARVFVALLIGVLTYNIFDSIHFY